MLLDKIKSDLVIAVKAQDEVRKLVLRSLLSAINYYKIELFSQRSLGEVGQRELGDEDVLKVIAKEVKKHRESIEMYKAAGRHELVEKEQKELDILLSYSPKQMDEAEVEKIIRVEVDKLKTKDAVLNPGLVMKAVMPVLKGKADGQIVKEMVDKLIK